MHPPKPKHSRTPKLDCPRMERWELTYWHQSYTVRARKRLVVFVLSTQNTAREYIMLTITRKLKELRHRKVDFEVSLSQKSLEEDGLQGIHLRKYQLDGVSWMKCCFKSGHGCILGDEMGLGKTIQVRKFITKS